VKSTFFFVSSWTGNSFLFTQKQKKEAKAKQAKSKKNFSHAQVGQNGVNCEVSETPLLEDLVNGRSV